MRLFNGFTVLTALKTFGISTVRLAILGAVITGCSETIDSVDAEIISENNAVNAAEIGPDFENSEAQNHKAHNIEVKDSYSVPPFPGRDIATGYFTLINHGPADQLIAASSPDAAMVEIHTHIDDGGIMRMRRVSGVVLAKDDPVIFTQGGYHLMFFGVDLQQGQDSLDVTLNFQNTEPMGVTLPLKYGGSAHYGSDGSSMSKPQEGKTYGSDNHGSDSQNLNSHGSGTQDLTGHGSGNRGTDNQGSGIKKSGG